MIIARAGSTPQDASEAGELDELEQLRARASQVHPTVASPDLEGNPAQCFDRSEVRASKVAHVEDERRRLSRRPEGRLRTGSMGA